MKQEDIHLSNCSKKAMICTSKSCPFLTYFELFVRYSAVVVCRRPHNVYIFGILVLFARG